MGYTVTARESEDRGYVARRVGDGDVVDCLYCGNPARHQYKVVRDGRAVSTDAYCGPACAKASVGAHTTLIRA